LFLNQHSSVKNNEKRLAKSIGRINNLLLAAVIVVMAAGTMVIVYLSNDTLKDISKIMPLIIFMLFTLILYSTARNVLLNKLIFTPLGRLTKSVSEARFDNTDFFGSDRKDEIHDPARTIQDVAQAQQRQEQLLFAVNSAATVLLETTEESFESSLLDGMELMGRCVSADRVYIMRNETIDRTHLYKR